jgi:hypothetical protein
MLGASGGGRLRIAEKRDQKILKKGGTGLASSGLRLA